jgi:4-hydroxythreonine-4-phosphate dehydrogenase
VLPGKPDARNASYVLNTIERGVSGCQSGEFAAMVTGPVQKSVINEGGYAFSGHTEYLAELCGSPQPVMLLCAGDLRVALLTTHLALRDVPAAITGERIERIARIVVADLMRYFRIETPRIAVLGLNPHSGEAGQLGREEIDVIIPALAKLKESGVHVTGPLPADSAFTPEALKQCDVVLAMYHDQGLPVLKHAGFGGAINVTLGLPIIRTSVDHGTALEIAGSGTARPDSLLLAIEMALGFARPDN